MMTGATPFAERPPRQTAPVAIRRRQADMQTIKEPDTP